MSDAQQAIDILQLEDSALDAELTAEHLRRGGLAHKVERVWTQEAFLAALQRRSYDLILADYTLPTFDGLSALKLAREHSPGTPFILVSATLGEELAIEAMREGASDFVVKDRLARLPVAVRRALEEARERAGRRQAEHRLEQINAQLESMVEARTRERDRIWRLSQDLFTVFDLDGRILSANPAWKTILGLNHTLIEGKHHTELKHPDDRDKGIATIIAGQQDPATAELEERYRHADDSYRWISWRAAAPEGDRIFAVGRDVTAAREQEASLASAEEQLRQSQKMEAIGRLTGGVAHDFNNLLTVIIGSLESLQRQGHVLSERGQDAIQNAMRGAQRAAKLTSSLLAFSRRQPLAPKPVEVNKLVSALSAILGRTLGEQVSVRTELAERLWWTHADPNQLEIAILNLAVNARDAMDGGGTLTLATSNTVLDADYCNANADAEPGEFVCLQVGDTGSGMDEAVIAQAFDPFFTTKDIGHGTGLGLSQVYGFVKQSGGHVKIHSTPGAGTTVKIYLPRSVAAEPAASETEHQAWPAAARGAAGETVLVVEDDEDVRRHSTSILREQGYQVLEAADGPDALAQIDAHPEIDLLFTDIGLPNGMNGRELAEQAGRRRPRLKILFTSGYARTVLVHDGKLDEDVNLISKPFAFAELARRIREILDSGQRCSQPRVLFIDDEPLIRMLAVDTLEEAGYRVEEAGSAQEAMERMRALDGRIDAAVIDFKLPDRQGDALAAELRAIRPALPIVIASGYGEADVRRRFEEDGSLGFLTKPYEPSQLLEALQSLGLGGSAAQAAADAGGA